MEHLPHTHTYIVFLTKTLHLYGFFPLLYLLCMFDYKGLMALSIIINHCYSPVVTMITIHWSPGTTTLTTFGWPMIPPSLAPPFASPPFARTSAREAAAGPIVDEGRPRVGATVPWRKKKWDVLDSMDGLKGKPIRKNVFYCVFPISCVDVSFSSGTNLSNWISIGYVIREHKTSNMPCYRFPIYCSVPRRERSKPTSCDGIV